MCVYISLHEAQTINMFCIISYDALQICHYPANLTVVLDTTHATHLMIGHNNEETISCSPDIVCCAVEAGIRRTGEITDIYV